MGGDQDPGDYGLNRDQLSLATRFPGDELRYVDECLAFLREAGVIRSTEYPKVQFSAFRERIANEFLHLGYSTYIFEEEARLLYALAFLLPGTRWAFLGSYYGYWAVWALPGLIARGGHAVLVDIDPAVQGLAKANFEALGGRDAVTFLTADATRASSDEAFDVLVLDAEGPKDHPDPRIRDKAIYGPILEAWLPALNPYGVVLAHNMLLNNPSGLQYFDSKVALNTIQYNDFHRLVDRHFDRRIVLDTTDGIGVYRRRDETS